MQKTIKNYLSSIFIPDVTLVLGTWVTIYDFASGWDGGISLRYTSLLRLFSKKCKHFFDSIATPNPRIRFAKQNFRVFGSRPVAGKKNTDQMVCNFLGWDGGIRTPECRHQKPVPYHLATSHQQYRLYTNQDVGSSLFKI